MHSQSSKRTVPQNMIDYPAAHSMDSTWWAVDGKGHVARIDTGEAGAMPADATDDRPGDEVLSLMARAGVPFYCDDLFGEADGKLYFRRYNQSWDEVGKNPVEAQVDSDYASGYLLWLRDEAALAELTPQATPPAPRPPSLGQRLRQLVSPPPPPPKPAGWSVLRLSVPGKVVVWVESDDQNSPPTPKRIRELLAAGVVLRAWGYDFSSLDPERFGVFHYQLETFDNWIAGPFERGQSPPRLTTAAELRAGAGDDILLCDLPGSDFSRDVLLQPFEHGAAYCWGEHWISTTGRQFRTEEHGPDLEGLQANPVQPTAAAAAGGSSLQALAAAYLNGEPGAAGVLNDFLEEAGQARIENFAAPAQRLDEVLVKLFAPAERQALELAFVQHALERSPPPPPAADAAQSTIATIRQALAGQATETQLAEAARAALRAWMPADEEIDEDSAPLRNNGVAWATWALARRWPLVAARSVRLTGPDELSWQCSRVIEQLMKTQ